MISNLRALALLVSLYGVAAVSCLESGGPCVNACRSLTDCGSGDANLSRDNERVLIDECLYTCRRDYWAKTYTDCLTSAKGLCDRIGSCTYAVSPPDAAPEETTESERDSDTGEALCTISCAQRQCYFGDIYCFDNCGNPETVAEACLYGCVVGSAVCNVSK